MNLRERVTEILTDNPNTRNNDMLLCAEYYQKHYGTCNLLELYTYYTHGEKMPMPESIRRTRQLIQAEGKLQPDKIMKEIRGKMEKEQRANKGKPYDFVEELHRVTKQYRCRKCGTAFRLGSYADEILTGMHCGACGGVMVVDE